MLDNNDFKFSNRVVVLPLLAVLIIWTVYWVELQFGMNLDHFGIYPRTLSGLKGILFSPFIHGSLAHLYSNTIPLAILTATLAYFYRDNAVKVLFLGIVLTGFFTWLIARPAYHIGASGLIYVLVSFIFFKGIFTKHYRLVALSLVVVFIYGSMLWYIFPVKGNISWEGHLSGFITGLLLAIFVKVKVPAVNKYDWEKENYKEEEDEFLKHFDEAGNFVENTPEEEDIEPTSIKIRYHYKEGKDNSEL